MSARFLFLVVFAAACSATADAAELSVYFRSDSGIAAADRVPLVEEVESDDVVLWRTPLGSGHSSPCVCGERIFLTTFVDGKLATVGLDRASGKVLWTQPAPHDRLEPFHSSGSPATSTPACDGIARRQLLRQLRTLVLRPRRQAPLAIADGAVSR